jgi:hypothetical protein
MTNTNFEQHWRIRERIAGCLNTLSLEGVPRPKLIEAMNNETHLLMIRDKFSTPLSPKLLFEGIREAYAEQEISDRIRQEYEFLIAECEGVLIEALRWGDWEILQAWVDAKREENPHLALARQAEYRQGEGDA